MPDLIRRPDLSELETLVLAADRGSIAAAAEALRISRVAASKRLRLLETISGTRLLTRGAGGISLTSEGRRVYAHARVLLAESDALLATLGLLKSGRSRSISGLDFLIGLADDAGRVPTTNDRLAATERLAAELFHASPVAIAVIDPGTGEFVDANDALCTLLARPRGELLGRKLEELGIGLLDPDGTYQGVRLSSAGEITAHRLRVTAGDATLDVSISSWPMRIGEQERRFCVIHDESLVRRLGQQLQAMTILADNLDVPISLTAVDGPLVYANDAFRRLLNLRAGEPLETVDPRGFLTEESAKTTAPQAREALGNGVSWRGTIRFVPRGGEPRPVEVVLIPIVDHLTGLPSHTATLVTGP